MRRIFICCSVMIIFSSFFVSCVAPNNQLQKEEGNNSYATYPVDESNLCDLIYWTLEFDDVTYHFTAESIFTNKIGEHYIIGYYDDKSPSEIKAFNDLVNEKIKVEVVNDKEVEVIIPDLSFRQIVRLDKPIGELIPDTTFFATHIESTDEKFTTHIFACKSLGNPICWLEVDWGIDNKDFVVPKQAVLRELP